MTRQITDHIRILIATIALLAAFATSAEAQTREYARMHCGMRAFKAGDNAAARHHYSRAAKLNADNPRIMFALGDIALNEHNDSIAISRFIDAVDHEENKVIKAMCYHNIGGIHFAYAYQAAQQIDSIPVQQRQEAFQRAIETCQKSIESYKMSLRNNPNNDDTRYNLALAQRLLKDLQDKAPKGNGQNDENPNESNSGNNNQQDDQSDEQDDNQNPDGKPKPNDNQQGQQPEDESMEQLLQLARQAEEQTRQRIQKSDAQSRPSRHLNKNW